jgi:hypothetical protein
MLIEFQEGPPVLRGMQDTHDCNAVRAGQIEDQKAFKPANPPFAQPGQLRRTPRQRRAHAGIAGEVREALAGVSPGTVPRSQRRHARRGTRARSGRASTGPLMDRRHRQSFFSRRLSCASASLRISSKSCLVSSLSSLSSPSISSRSSALRFSSSRMSSRIYSLTVLSRPLGDLMMDESLERIGQGDVHGLHGANSRRYHPSRRW